MDVVGDGMGNQFQVISCTGICSFTVYNEKGLTI